MDTDGRWDLLAARDIGARGVRWTVPLYALLSAPGQALSTTIRNELNTFAASGFKLAMLLLPEVDNRAGGWDSTGTNVYWAGWVPTGVQWRAQRLPPNNDEILNHVANYMIQFVTHAVSTYQAWGYNPAEYLEIELGNEPRLVTYAATSPASSLTINGSTTSVIKVASTSRFTAGDIIRVTTSTRQWGTISTIGDANTINLTAALTDPQYGPATAPASGIMVVKCDNYQNSPYSVDQGYWYSINYLLGRLKTAFPNIRVWAPALFAGSSGSFNFSPMLTYAQHLTQAYSVSGYTNFSLFDGFCANIYYGVDAATAEFHPTYWGRRYLYYCQDFIMAFRRLPNSIGFETKPLAITEYGVNRVDLRQGESGRQWSETSRGIALREATHALQALPIHRVTLFTIRDGGNYTISSSQYGLITVLGRASIALKMMSVRTSNALNAYPSYYAVPQSGWFYAQDLATGYQYEDNTQNTNSSGGAVAAGGGGGAD